MIVQPPFDPSAAISPSELNLRARVLLESQMAVVKVHAELSSVTRAASGHWYFSLTDGKAQVRSVMFKPRAVLLRFVPANGLAVEAWGRVSLYEPRGEFQFIAEFMAEAGAGAASRQLEALKRQLHAEGLFDSTRKRPLPAYPVRIALITGKDSAAQADVIALLRERWPLVELLLVPALVQGLQAPESLRRALALAIRSSGADLIVLSRGGGASEDLKAFNDEFLCRELAASPVPTVSAVGHEINLCLTDLVADLRVATPSAAVAAIVPDRNEVAALLAGLRTRLERAARQRLDRALERVDRARATLAVLDPLQRLAAARRRLGGLAVRMHSAIKQALVYARMGHRHGQQRFVRCAPTPTLERARADLTEAKGALQGALRHGLSDRRQRLDTLAMRLAHVDPLDPIKRGYALLVGDDGQVLTTIAAIKRVPALWARVSDGRVRLAVGADS